MEHIGRFEVERSLGGGTFASVWLARDPDLRTRVAVKVLAHNWSLDPEIKRRFLEEARIMRRLDHSRIASVYAVEHLDDGRPYFVMQFADRGTLHERMRHRLTTGQGFSVDEALAMSRELAECVLVAHDLGVVHRDLKPSNVLFRTVPPHHQEEMRRRGVDPPAEQMILADFGIARTLEAATQFTIAAGTPHYMAPEQAEGTADGRSDVYACAVILFELLAGETPYPYSSIGEIIRRRLTEPLPSILERRPDVPDELDRLLHLAMAANPDERVPTARAWVDSLGRITTGLRPPPRPPTPRPQPPAPPAIVEPPVEQAAPAVHDQPVVEAAKPAPAEPAAVAEAQPADADATEPDDARTAPSADEARVAAAAAEERPPEPAAPVEERPGEPEPPVEDPADLPRDHLPSTETMPGRRPQTRPAPPPAEPARPEARAVEDEPRPPKEAAPEGVRAGLPVKPERPPPKEEPASPSLPPAKRRASTGKRLGVLVALVVVLGGGAWAGVQLFGSEEGDDAVAPEASSTTVTTLPPPDLPQPVLDALPGVQIEIDDEMVYTSAQVAESRWAASEGTIFDGTAGLAIVPSGATLSKGDVQADVDLILPGQAALIEIASTASTYDVELVRPDVAWGITFESGRITRGSSDGLELGDLPTRSGEPHLVLLAVDGDGTLRAQTWRAADPDTVITTSTLSSDLGIAPDQGWELRLRASLGAVRVDHYWELIFESVAASPSSADTTTTTPATPATTTTLAGQALEAPDVPVPVRFALGDVRTLAYDKFESLDGWSAGGATLSNGRLVSTNSRIERIERLGYGEAGLFRVSFAGSAMVRVGADAGSPTDPDFQRAAVILREGQPSWEFYNGGIKSRSYQLDIPIRPNVEYYVLVARSSSAVLVKVWNTGPTVVSREETRGLTDASTLFVEPTEGLGGSAIVHEFWHLSFTGSVG